MRLSPANVNSAFAYSLDVGLMNAWAANQPTSCVETTCNGSLVEILHAAVKPFPVAPRDAHACQKLLLIVRAHIVLVSILT